MAEWKVYADGIEEISHWYRGEDTLTTKQWWRYASWIVTTDDDNPPDIKSDTDMNDIPYRACLEDVGEFKGSMDYDSTCDLSTNEDGCLNIDELYQPEDFDWLLDRVELWIRFEPEISEE